MSTYKGFEDVVITAAANGIIVRKHSTQGAYTIEHGVFVFNDLPAFYAWFTDYATQESKP